MVKLKCQILTYVYRYTVRDYSASNWVTSLHYLILFQPFKIMYAFFRRQSHKQIN